MGKQHKERGEGDQREDNRHIRKKNKLYNLPPEEDLKLMGIRDDLNIHFFEKTMHLEKMYMKLSTLRLILVSPSNIKNTKRLLVFR